MLAGMTTVRQAVSPSLTTLLLDYGAARAAEGACIALAPENRARLAVLVEKTSAIWRRIERRIARLEELGRMGGIAPEDVCAALRGEWWKV